MHIKDWNKKHILNRFVKTIIKKSERPMIIKSCTTSLSRFVVSGIQNLFLFTS